MNYNVLISFLLFAAPSLSSLGDDQAKKEFYKRIEQQALESASKNKFQLSGKIIDNHGKPLDGVTVQIEKSISMGFFGSKQTGSEVVVDRKFNFPVENCNVVRLVFSKDGYYSTEQSFIDWELKNRKINDIFTISDLTVTLNSRGTPYDYKKDTFLLSLNPGKEKRLYFPLTRKQPRITDSPEASMIEKNYFDIEFGKDENGKVEMMEYRDRTVPRRILFRLNSGPEEGLLPTSGSNDGLSLTTAPETGYSDQPIILSAQDDLTTQPAYFFFKVGGVYGKGYVFRVSADSTGNVRVSAAILLNQETVEKKKRMVHGYILK